MRALRFVCLAVCVVSLMVVCGCHSGGVGGGGDNGGGGGGDNGGGGGGDNGGGGGGAAIPLGQMRQLQVGDTWTFQLSGTFAPAGGGLQNVTRADAVVTYRDPINAVVIPGTHEWDVRVQIAYPGVAETHGNTAAVTQDASGRIDLHGYAPMFDAETERLVGGAVLQGPDPAAFATTANWNGTTQLDLYGALEITAQNHGVENVTVPAGTFAAYRVTGTKNLGGWVTNYEAWINPQTGLYVKMIVTSTDIMGTLTLSYELKNTNVPLS